MLDITTFPIIYVSQSDFASTDLETALESLIARRQHFVLITPQDSARDDTGVSPEERKRQGLLLDDSVFHNVSLPSLGRFARGG